MKNALLYFYDIRVDDLKVDKDYYFFMNNQKVILYDVSIYSKEEINYVYNLDLFILNYFPVHKIIKNKFDEVVTKIDNKDYVLLVCKNYTGIINFDDVIYFMKRSFSYFSSGKFDIISLWINKDNYLLDEVRSSVIKYDLIKESFDYYLFLGELSISIYNIFLNENIDNYVSICHKRIDYQDKFNFYNPFNITFDINARDISEYLKDIFYSNLYSIDTISSYINYYFSLHLPYFYYLYFFVRMIYPTYYFDEVIRIYNKENNNVDKIRVIIDKHEEYEFILKFIWSKLNEMGVNIDFPL